MRLQQLKSAGFVKGAGIVAGIITLMIFGNYLLSPPNNTPDTKSPRERVAEVPKPPQCPGNAETIVVRGEWVLINPGFRCAVVFNTTTGRALLGAPDNYVEDAPGLQVGNVMRERGIRVIYAKAQFGEARVNYMLCPHGSTSPNRWGCGS